MAREFQSLSLEGFKACGATSESTIRASEQLCIKLYGQTSIKIYFNNS